MKFFFESVKFFFDLMHRFGIGFFDLLREQIFFDKIKNYDRAENDEENRNADLFEVADNICHRAAEKIADTAEKQNPDRTAYKIEKQKSAERHFADAVEKTHRDAQPVNIF